MSRFNVVVYNFNEGKFEPYDIIPYLKKSYYNEDEKPSTFEEFKNFVLRRSACQWWVRCEYEIILVDWPNKSHAEKWDVHKQVEMNIDVITDLLIKEVS